MFELWPAIDVLGGRIVRLQKGQYDHVRTYDVTVQSVITELNQFATGIHVVDLDGARSGALTNATVMAEILTHATVPVEVGGGIRTVADAQRILDMGVSRVIFGSAAVKTPAVVQEALAQFGGEKVVLGVDTHNGYIATDGWEATSTIMATDLIHAFIPHGLTTVIATDIATDGMLQGPNTTWLQALKEAFPTLNIIASGGMANMRDIAKLAENNLDGVVFGKAYYEGLLPLAELITMKEHAV